MWYIIILLLSVVYALINILLPGMFSGFFLSYVIRPIVWVMLAISIFLIARYEGINILSFNKVRRWQIGNSPIHAGFLVGGFQISLLVIAGIFLGFGQSPNLITASSFFIFLLYIFAAIFGIELARSYLVKKGTGGRKNATLWIGLIALLFALIKIKLTDFTSLTLSEPAPLLEFVGGTFIALIAMSLFATYLAYYGGALPAIIYMSMLHCFEMYSPLLPDIDWIVKAFIQVLSPTIGFLLIQQSLQDTGKTSKKKIQKKKDPAITWVGVSVICLLLVFFSFGYFGVTPTIISSGSMKPTLDTGDIVILTDPEIRDIQEGDIIQFTWNNFSTIHRVYEVQGPKDSNNKVFVTKGDANENPDVDIVLSDQVTGKVVFNLPKIGWVPLFFKSVFKNFGINI